MYVLAATASAVSDGLAIGLAVIGTITGGGGIVATIFAYGRVKAVEQTLTLLRSENDTLTGLVRASEARAEEERKTCSERIAELDGQVKVLTQQQAHSTVAAIMAVARESGYFTPSPFATPHNRPEGGTA